MRGLWILMCLALASCASAASSPGAPQPLKPIDPSRFFTGRWYEIARTPMSLTNGCVAGTTDFYHRADGQLIERDACHKGSPEGSVKVFKGPVKILNPGQNNKFTVHYTLYWVIPLTANYWVLDHASDYSWFIVSTPSFHNIALLDRDPRPSPAVVASLNARARALGYDTGKLEFPTLTGTIPGGP